MSDTELVALTEHHTQTQIATMFGALLIEVNHRLRQSGLTYTRHKGGRKPFTPEERAKHRAAFTKKSRLAAMTDEQLVERINGGETMAEIAAECGVSRARVQQRLAQSGLDYTRHWAMCGRGFQRGTDGWRASRRAEALVRVAEYARSVRAEHDRLESELARVKAEAAEARSLLTRGRPFDAYGALDAITRGALDAITEPTQGASREAA